MIQKTTKKIRTVYDGELVKVPADVGGPSLTKQQFVADADINNILGRFKKTGQIDPELLRQNPVSGDFSEIGTYQESLDMVHKAEALFEALPSRLRDRFRNDPTAFVAYATDPKNKEELIELGLATKPISEAPEQGKQAPKKEPEPPAGKPAGGSGSQQAP